MSDEVAVALCPHIPIEGVSFINGNYVAGGRVLVTPEVVSTPIVLEGPGNLEQQYPGIPPVCVATCAMTRAQIKKNESEIALTDTFFARGDALVFGFD